MKGYKSETIRNVALVGHGGCGKTTILESALFSSGETTRAGRVEDGNTVSDYDKMEIEKKFSINTTVAPVEWKDIKINFIDTPGYFDFIGEVKSALRAVECAVVVVDASAGVQVGTEKAWHVVHDDMPAFLLLNKIDKENIDFDRLMNELKQKFGKMVAPFILPIMEDGKMVGQVNVVEMNACRFSDKGDIPMDIPKNMEGILTETRDMLIESVAETDENLLEKFFGGEEFTQEEVHMGLRKGIAAGSVVPVLASSATQNRGIINLLDAIKEYVPNPTEHTDYIGINEAGEVETRKVMENGRMSALIFKTIIDPFVGKISIMKVISGTIKVGTEVYNMREEKLEKIGHLFFIRGKNQVELDYADAGDIVAIAKSQFAQTGDTLCDKSARIQYPGIGFPKPSLYMAVEPKAKGDEEKIFSGLRKLMEEDPSFEVTRNAETKQTLIGGQGEMQISIMCAKLKEKFGVSVDLVDQKIAYRETIKGSSDVQGKHKKQSGGAGQYGDVHIKFSPSTEHFLFEEKLFGGSVPKQYVPAVEKGLRDSLDKGPLSGFPVTNIHAVLYDGSYHDVDSNEMAFKMAASLAFKKGIMEAKPVILEPVVKVEILVPDDYTGDVMGDMNKRRGRILGMEPMETGGQKIIAEAPMAEMFKYAITLRSMTQARGTFLMTFERYEEVPVHVAEKIIAEHERHDE